MDGLNLSHAGLLADPSAMTNTDWSHRAETTSKLYAEATNQLMPPVDVGKRHTMGDLFCGVGGYPCQPFSQMGKRFGRRDPRDTLIYPTVDIVAAIDPDAVVLENSNGFANDENGRTLADTKEMFARIGHLTDIPVMHTAVARADNERIVADLEPGVRGVVARVRAACGLGAAESQRSALLFDWLWSYGIPVITQVGHWASSMVPINPYPLRFS